MVKNIKLKTIVIVIVSIVAIILGVGIGSVFISPSEIIEILAVKLFGRETAIPAITIGIFWNMRLPRVLLAFLVGAVLSLSGVVMQSVLQNPLASSYTLGVSSGSAFGVCLFIVLGLSSSLLGIFTMPVVGLIFGVLTVVLAVGFSSSMDKRMGNQTIILVGMVFSMFMNALLTVMMSFSRETQERMMQWQMGSFALKDWNFVLALLPIALIGLLVLMFFSRELDNLTFGEESATVVGINVKKMKWLLLGVSAALTGCAVSLAGVIGFVDLIIPHIVRRLFGSAHKRVLPMSAMLGGSFMVIADVIARTIVSPSEMPIGAVTAIIGAPFFVYIYFQGRTKSA